MNRKVITTKDGSSSIFWEELNESYHSIHGAWQESLHVFIQEGIDWFTKKHPHKTDIQVFEVGLGTGLNAILTLQYALLNPHISISYHSVEAFPLTTSEMEHLNYKALLDTHLVSYFSQIHTSSWNILHEFTPNFKFQKYHSKLNELILAEQQFDVIYYDAFAPTKQEEMWDLLSLTKARNLLASKGILVTYCAKGYVKRNLKALGMSVESPQGAAGKREMTRATKT